MRFRRKRCRCGHVAKVHYGPEARCGVRLLDGEPFRNAAGLWVQLRKACDCRGWGTDD